MSYEKLREACAAACMRAMRSRGGLIVKSSHYVVCRNEVLAVPLPDDYEATKSGWNSYLETRSKINPPRSIGVIIRGHEAIEMSNPMGDVYGGRQQGKFNKDQK